MSICVECDSSLEQESLYTEYSEGNIRLTRCVSEILIFALSVLHSNRGNAETLQINILNMSKFLYILI